METSENYELGSDSFLVTVFLFSLQIKTMGIHESKHPEVQFVMAVRAFPLYNNILSLWVFLGTLEPIPGH